MSDPEYIEEEVRNYRVKDQEGTYHKYGENRRLAATHFIRLFNAESEDYAIVQEKKLDKYEEYEGFFVVDLMTYKILHHYSTTLKMAIQSIKELREENA